MIRPNRPRIQNRIGDRKRLLSSNILHMKRRTIPNASSHNSKFQHLTVNWTTRQAAKSSLPNALQDHILHQCQNGVTFARLRSAAPTAVLWKKYWMNVVHSNRMGEISKFISNHTVVFHKNMVLAGQPQQSSQHSRKHGPKLVHAYGRKEASWKSDFERYSAKTKRHNYAESISLETDLL